MDEANGIFQAAEGSLDPPTHGVETFQGGGRKLLWIQVGNEKLGIAVFCFNTNDPERKGSKTSAFRLYIIEGHLGRDTVIGGRNRKPLLLQLPHCLPAQGDLGRNIELRCIREFLSVGDGPVFVPEADEVVPTLFLQVWPGYCRPHIPGPPKG